ncbi:8822_t:CDS:2 [Entrophospora sp. SA101]|nr:8822_t:CDS:2 [Entrophospora sp. SA101]CAJ0878381.1 8745_t:CDS:2 [Entrophospora sp. SA101]
MGSKAYRPKCFTNLFIAVSEKIFYNSTHSLSSITKYLVNYALKNSIIQAKKEDFIYIQNIKKSLKNSNSKMPWFNLRELIQGCTQKASIRDNFTIHLPLGRMTDPEQDELHFIIPFMKEKRILNTKNNVRE